MAVQAIARHSEPEQDWSPPQEQWGYEDYRRLPDDGWRYEIIEGDLHISPAPGTRHQEVSLNLATALVNLVRAKGLGRVFTAPTEVRLGKLADPVQPDIVFIRGERAEIIKAGWVEGAPGLIVEILSPSNWIDDRRAKYRVYGMAGVQEYWIVDPARREVDVYVLRRAGYELMGRFGAGERVTSEVVTGFHVDVDEVCPA